MKYKNFNEWFINGMLILKDFEDTIGGMRKIMRAAWDAAVNNYPEDPNAVIGQKIHELLTTLKDAMKIDCTCDKIKIKGGAPCICVRAGAIMMSTKELGAYLRKLRKELK